MKYPNCEVTVDYDEGWAIITGAFNSDGELARDRAREKIRRIVIVDGYAKGSFVVSDETNLLEDWEARRTGKPFKRPHGMLIFRLHDRTGQNGFGKKEFKEWPAK